MDYQPEQLQGDVELLQPASERVDQEYAVGKRASSTTTIVEIDARVEQLIPGGSITRRGIYRYQVPTVDLPILMAMARTDEDRRRYAIALESFERKVAHVLDGTDQKHDTSLPEIREHRLARQNGDAETTNRLEREIRASLGFSPEGILMDEFRQSLPPFERVTIVAEQPNPFQALKVEREKFEKAQRSSDNAAMAEVMASAFAKANAEQAAAIVKVLEPLLEQRKAGK